MNLKSALAWLAAVVVGASLGQAQAATLVVDDFDALGTPPAGNQWNASGKPVLGGVREFTKISGTWAAGTGAHFGTLKYTAPGATTSRVEMKYDSVNGTTGYFNPVKNLSAYTYLNIKGNFKLQAATTAVASLSTQLTSGPGFSDSSLTLASTAGADGIFRFKLSNLAPVPALAKVGRIFVRLNGLAAGDTFVDKIFFTDYYVPEPSTFVLAGLAVVGLAIARHKKK